MPYCQLNMMLDDGFPRGALHCWKSAFLSGLGDDAIRTMIDSFAQCPTPMGALMLKHFHGAVTRVGVTDTAFPHRDEGHNLLVLGQWTDPKDSEACISWARDAYNAMAAFMRPGRYVNYWARMSRVKFPRPMARTTGDSPRSRRSTIQTTSSE
jgi:hypothetical protein